MAIAPFNLDLAGVGNKPSALTLSGGIGKASISGNIETSLTGRKLTLAAGDAGQLIQGLFNFQSIKGGKLRLSATLPGRASDPDLGLAAPDYQGTLDIDDFQVVNQPLLARLFSAGSLTGIGDLMGGDGISLENMNVPFSSKNNVISVHDARARGRAIGATADGYIDRPKNQIALKGSLVPAYGLNSVLGNRRQSTVGADARNLAPHFRGSYADRRQRAVERACHRAGAAETVAKLVRLHQNVLFLAAGELQHAVAV